MSARQIASGMTVFQDPGLTNIDLRIQSIFDVPEVAGQFNDINAHAVLSWVPEPVRDKILKICREQLAPHAVAMVSHNTFPGCHQRCMIRDGMLFHKRLFLEPEKRIQQAKVLLQYVIDHQIALQHNDQVVTSQDGIREFLQAKLRSNLEPSRRQTLLVILATRRAASRQRSVFFLSAFYDFVF